MDVRSTYTVVCCLVLCNLCTSEILEGVPEYVLRQGPQKMNCALNDSAVVSLMKEVSVQNLVMKRMADTPSARWQH